MTAARVAVVAAAVLVTGCAARAPERPTGSAVDAPDAVPALEAATRHCRPLRTATAEIRLSGNAGRERVRARLRSGFAEPDSLRLEALAPFGPPALVFASNGAVTTLFFPRDQQVLRDAPVAAVLDALTGLALDAGDLRRLIFGCVSSDGGRGTRYGSTWQVVEAGDTRAFLKAGVLVAADYRGWQVDYTGHEQGIARAVRVRRPLTTGALDLVAVLASVETNIPLDAAAFLVTVPADASPITLDDLRAASPFAAREP
jgi:outer membrane biogenesis lipoprotein LolB